MTRICTSSDLSFWHFYRFCPSVNFSSAKNANKGCSDRLNTEAAGYGTCDQFINASCAARYKTKVSWKEIESARIFFYTILYTFPKGLTSKRHTITRWRTLGQLNLITRIRQLWFNIHELVNHRMWQSCL